MKRAWCSGSFLAVIVLSAVAAAAGAGSPALMPVDGLPLSLTAVDSSMFLGPMSAEGQSVLELAVSGGRLGEARALELEVVVFDEGGEVVQVQQVTIELAEPAGSSVTLASAVLETGTSTRSARVVAIPSGLDFGAERWALPASLRTEMLLRAATFATAKENPNPPPQPENPGLKACRDACEAHFTSCRTACTHCTSMTASCSCNGGSINTTCTCGGCTQ